MIDIIEKDTIIKLYNGRELVVKGNTYEEDGDLENLNYYCIFMGRDNENSENWYDIMIPYQEIKWVHY